MNLNPSAINALHSKVTEPNVDGTANRESDVLDVHAVILTNYVRTHHVLAFQEFAKRVRQLTVLLSVPMEPDREWDAAWGGLDVRVQRNLMWTANWQHSSGFSEPNFVHFPIDTPLHLKRLKPDVIISYEMGVRTMLSTLYRMFHRNVPLIAVGNMSEHIEKERGVLRKTWRKLICRGVHYYTYNGPSCKRYMNSLGISDSQLFHFPYCINDATVNQEEKSDNETTLKLLYCGAISQRKGILQFSEALSRWCSAHPEKNVEFSIAGSGELREQVAACSHDSLSINFLGNCDVNQLREAYGNANICVFPTLADEWGLVPIEAMASGIPVLGSIHAQSVETCCVDSVNSWTFDSGSNEAMEDAINRAMLTPRKKIREMGQAAKASVAHISPRRSGNLLADAVSKIVPTC